MTDNYGEQIKSYRIKLGLTQNQVAAEMDVTPGYISNVENGRTAMSLRFLIYYAKLMGVTLDELVGNLEPDYTSNALDNALIAEISKMDDAEKKIISSVLDRPCKSVFDPDFLVQVIIRKGDQKPHAESKGP